jgi:hypothetical protein
LSCPEVLAPQKLGQTKNAVRDVLANPKVMDGKACFSKRKKK